jgi:hypothetical protein
MMVIVDQEGLFVQLTPLRWRVERVRGVPSRVERISVVARQTSS